MDDVVEYDPLWSDLMGSAYTQAASWWLAERLIKACDVARLAWSNTPEGVGYDTLHVEITHEGRDCAVWINRGGSVHVISGGRDVRLGYPGVWTAMLTPAGREEVLREVFSRLGVQPRHGRPSTPRSVMCRVLADAMYMAIPRSGEWGTQSEAPRHNPEYERLSDEFPVDINAVREAWEAGLTWAIVHDWQPIARFKDGWMWLRSGERVDLFGSYRAGVSTTELAARVHAQSTTIREVPTGLGEFSPPEE